MMTNKKPYSIIKFDKTTGQLEKPNILLKTRDGRFIDNIPYENLQISFVGKGLDEISFDVYKYKDNIAFESWDKLIDLAIVDYVGYGQFQAKVSTNDSEETIKTVVCQSLETELGQRYLHEFHINDEDYFNVIDVEYNEKDGVLYTNYNNHKTTVLWRLPDKEYEGLPYDEEPDYQTDKVAAVKRVNEEFSLLSRALNEKAPHWSVGYVSPLFNVNGYVYACDSLQRTFTVDGTAIYDFFDGDVSDECCCIFSYDTYNRKVNCYNLEPCVYRYDKMEAVKGWYYINGVYYDDENNGYDLSSAEAKLGFKISHCDGIGEFTNIYLSKNKLANSFTRDSDDSVKNCFRVEGGDDIITNQVGAANLTGNNYIYLFSQFQYDDMNPHLSDALNAYQVYLENSSESFYDTGGIYTVVDMDAGYSIKDGIAYDPNGIILTTAKIKNGEIYINNSLAHFDTMTYYYDSINKKVKDCKLKYSGFGTPSIEAEDGDFYLNKNNGNIYLYTGTWNKYSTVNMLDEYDKPVKYIYEDDGGIYTHFVAQTDYCNYLEHSKFPNTSLNRTTVADQKKIIEDYFNVSTNKIVISSSWTSDSYAHVTSTIDKFIPTIIDNRYTSSVNANSCTASSSIPKSGVWKGIVTLEREATNEKDSFEISINLKQCIDNESDLSFLQQKMELAIAKMDLMELDFSKLDSDELFNLLMKYNLTQVKSYADAFESCVSTLADLYSNLGVSADKINKMKKQDNPPSNPKSGDYWYCTKDSTNYSKGFVYVYENGTWATALTGRVSIVISDMYTERANIANLVYDIKLAMFNDEKATLDKLDNEISEFREECDMYNFFKKYIEQHSLDVNVDDMWNWFQSYVREDTYSNTNYISDGLTDSELQKKAKELLTVAKKELEKACLIQYRISGDLNNIFAANELKELYEKFALFNYVFVNVDDKLYRLRMTEISFSDSDPGKIDVTFSEQVEGVDGSFNDTKKILEQSSSIATSYSSVTKQALQGSSAMNTFYKMQQEGLDSSMYLLKSSVDEEQIFGSTGIWCKSMIDEGVYSDNMLRIISNGLYISDDGFKTVNTAIGRFKFNNDWTYGVNAQTIIGKLLVGEKMIIEDENGNVQIDGSGVKIDGGYLHLNNDTTHTSIEINPNHIGDYDGKTTDRVINVRTNNNVEGEDPVDVFYITDSGDGYFNGEIYATKGTFNGSVNATSGSIGSGSTKWTINDDGISYFDNSGYGIQINSSGIFSKGKILTITGSYVDKITSISNGFIDADEIYTDKVCSEDGIYIVSGNDSIFSEDEYWSYINMEKKKITIGLGTTSGSISPDFKGVFMGNNTLPTLKDSYSLGNATYRWNNVYAKNTTIQTSDRNSKNTILDISNKYEDLFFKIKPKTFKFNNGDRVHIGAISQDVESAMRDVGLLDVEFGGFCKDKDELDSNNYIYGLRYGEFIMLNTHMIQKAYKIIEYQQEEINKLKEMIKEQN